MKIKPCSLLPPGLGVWVRENLLTWLTSTEVQGAGGARGVSCDTGWGAGAGPTSCALPAFSIFSFKLAFLLLQLGLSVSSTNGL